MLIAMKKTKNRCLDVDLGSNDLEACMAWLDARGDYCIG